MVVKVRLSDFVGGLQPRHRRFVEEYVRDWNATAAYKRAGYQATGHGAESNASRLCRRPDVAAAVDAIAAHVDAEVEKASRGESSASC